MLAEFDPLLGFRCPHCGVSLRFRRLLTLDPARAARDGVYHCPACRGPLREHRHPALSDNWRWSRFTLPGVLLCALCIFVPALTAWLPVAVAIMVLGLTGLVVYMIRGRWRWRQYRRPEDGD